MSFIIDAFAKALRSFVDWVFPESASSRTTTAPLPNASTQGPSTAGSIDTTTDTVGTIYYVVVIVILLMIIASCGSTFLYFFVIKKKKSSPVSTQQGVATGSNSIDVESGTPKTSSTVKSATSTVNKANKTTGGKVKTMKKSKMMVPDLVPEFVVETPASTATAAAAAASFFFLRLMKKNIPIPLIARRMRTTMKNMAISISSTSGLVEIVVVVVGGGAGVGTSTGLFFPPWFPLELSFVVVLVIVVVVGIIVVVVGGGEGLDPKIKLPKPLRPLLATPTTVLVTLTTAEAAPPIRSN